MSLSDRMRAQVARRRGPTPEPERPKRVAPLLPKGGSVVRFDAETPVTNLLTKDRTIGTPPRSISEYLHVSDLLNKCIRKVAIVETMGISLPSKGVSLMDDLTYAQGDAIHDRLRDRIRNAAPELIFGHWSCGCKKTKTKSPCTFDKVKALKCQHCGSHLTRYVEVSIFNEEHKIVGNPDVLMLRGAATHITELKSMSDKMWGELLRPIPDHVVQTLFYWWLMREQGYTLTDRISILYATKGYTFKGLPVKEFVIEAAPQMARLKPYLDEAKAIKAARQGGQLPKRVCGAPDEKEAKNCQVCKVCFEGTNHRPVEVSIAAALGASDVPTRRPRYRSVPK